MLEHTPSGAAQPTHYTYLHNLQGDIVAIVDAIGTRVVQYGYDAWGRITHTGTLTDEYAPLAKLNPFRYRGYLYDEETQLYYLRSRYYNPEWGRFLNEDSLIGETGVLLGHNVFAYCRNNPVVRDDPDGLYDPDAMEMDRQRRSEAQNMRMACNVLDRIVCEYLGLPPGSSSINKLYDDHHKVTVFHGVDDTSNYQWLVRSGKFLQYTREFIEGYATGGLLVKTTFQKFMTGVAKLWGKELLASDSFGSGPFIYDLYVFEKKGWFGRDEYTCFMVYDFLNHVELWEMHSNLLGWSNGHKLFSIKRDLTGY